MVGGEMLEKAVVRDLREPLTLKQWKGTVSHRK